MWHTRLFQPVIPYHIGNTGKTGLHIHRQGIEFGHDRFIQEFNCPFHEVNIIYSLYSVNANTSSTPFFPASPCLCLLVPAASQKPVLRSCHLSMRERFFMPNQQEVFEAAHAHVAKWEGGYFDHPNDPGGVTMYGVSLMFLKGLDLWEGDIDGDGDIDRDDVLAVTKDTARDIFKRYFWDRPRAGEMPPLVAVCFYDFAVNAGVPRAARMLQGLLRVEADGIVGRNTLTAAESCNQRELASFMLLERERWYRGLVAKKPKSAAFLRGWLNRTSDCRALVERLAARWGITE